MLMPKLRHGVGGGMREPLCFHVERRATASGYAGFSAFLRCGMQYFDTMKVPRVFYAHHQVEPLHVGHLRVGQADGAGIVDADVDAAELGYGLLDGRDHLTFVP